MTSYHILIFNLRMADVVTLYHTKYFLSFNTEYSGIISMFRLYWSGLMFVFLTMGNFLNLMLVTGIVISCLRPMRYRDLGPGVFDWLCCLGTVPGWGCHFFVICSLM